MPIDNDARMLCTSARFDEGGVEIAEQISIEARVSKDSEVGHAEGRPKRCYLPRLKVGSVHSLCRLYQNWKRRDKRSGVESPSASSERSIKLVTKAKDLPLDDVIITSHDLLEKYREEERSQRAEIQRRIKVMINQEIFEAPIFALHEVFIGEKDASKTSYFKIAIDGKPAERQKSSGMIISFPGGNSEWFETAARVRHDTVSNIIGALRLEGIDIPQDGMISDRVTEQINNKYTQPASDEANLLFCVREAIINKTFAPAPTKGTAKRLHLTCLSWNIQLVLDGNHHFDIPKDSEIIIEIEPGDTV